MPDGGTGFMDNLVSAATRLWATICGKATEIAGRIVQAWQTKSIDLFSIIVMAAIILLVCALFRFSRNRLRPRMSGVLYVDIYEDNTDRHESKKYALRRRRGSVRLSRLTHDRRFQNIAFRYMAGSQAQGPQLSFENVGHYKGDLFHIERGQHTEIFDAHRIKLVIEEDPAVVKKKRLEYPGSPVPNKFTCTLTYLQTDYEEA